jgi:hypothetical protein
MGGNTNHPSDSNTLKLATNLSTKVRAHHRVYSPNVRRTYTSPKGRLVVSPSGIASYGVYSNNLNTSPTTVTDPDITTPSTDRDSNLSDETRCVCGTSDGSGQLMIQW